MYDERLVLLSIYNEVTETIGWRMTERLSYGKLNLLDESDLLSACLLFHYLRRFNYHLVIMWGVVRAGEKVATILGDMGKYV